jgi:hypothetical protein
LAAAALLHLLFRARLRLRAVCLAAAALVPLLHLRPRPQAVCSAALLHLRPRPQAVCSAGLLHLRFRPRPP